MLIPEGKITEIYCLADDFCKLFSKGLKKHQLIHEDGKKHRNKPNRMSDAEIITILILFHCGGFVVLNISISTMSASICGICFQKLFPKTVSYNLFAELQKEVLFPMSVFIKKVLLGKCTGISYIGSTQLRICRNQRIRFCKNFKGIAERGKCSMGWFYGFKLHLIINDKSEILNFMFTPGNVDDREPLYSESFINAVKGKLCGDSVYISKSLFENLFINGIQLITKVKNNMKNMLMSAADKIILRQRAVIESVNDELKNIAQIEHLRHRSFANFIANSLSAIAAYCFFPKKPSVNVEFIYDNQLVLF